jgi:ribosomal protein L37E
MPQGYSGWEHYWRHHPREVCPKCGRKTYIQPSKAEGWHDNDWKYVKIHDRLMKVLQKRCYLCGYLEPLTSEYWEKKPEGQQFLKMLELEEKEKVQWERGGAEHGKVG